MSSNKKRINLSFSMSSPIQRRAWKKLTEIPAGQRTAAVCRMVCEYKGQQELLDAVRQTIRQELRGMRYYEKCNGFITLYAVVFSMQAIKSD